MIRLKMKWNEINKYWKKKKKKKKKTTKKTKQNGYTLPLQTV